MNETSQEQSYDPNTRPVRGFYRDRVYRELKSGQEIKTLAVCNDSETETGWLRGVVVNPGIYQDPENGVGKTVNFAFWWMDFEEVIPPPQTPSV